VDTFKFREASSINFGEGKFFERLLFNGKNDARAQTQSPRNDANLCPDSPAG
jgi:hypothetical protein